MQSRARRLFRACPRDPSRPDPRHHGRHRLRSRCRGRSPAAHARRGRAAATAGALATAAPLWHGCVVGLAATARQPRRAPPARVVPGRACPTPQPSRASRRTALEFQRRCAARPQAARPARTPARPGGPRKLQPGALAHGGQIDDDAARRIEHENRCARSPGKLDGQAALVTARRRTDGLETARRVRRALQRPAAACEQHQCQAKAAVARQCETVHVFQRLTAAHSRTVIYVDTASDQAVRASAPPGLERASNCSVMPSGGDRQPQCAGRAAAVPPVPAPAIRSTSSTPARSKSAQPETLELPRRVRRYRSMCSTSQPADSSRAACTWGCGCCR